MTGNILIFGMGYTASRLGERLAADGWQIVGTRREASAVALGFADRSSVEWAIVSATHILSSVPPSANGGDPVLEQYGDAIKASSARWVGYLSSTGVYGDTGGAWVDESAKVGTGRRTARAQADIAWQSIGSVFRLPGIYGPGRSALDRVRDGKAHRIDLPEQVFSRVHVDDIVAAIIASFAAPRDVFNIADDVPCSQNQVIEHACNLLDIQPPPLQNLDAAGLSPMARGFYAENRRVSNRRAKHILDWLPIYPDYRAGLLACMATSNPTITNAAPDVANKVQR